MDTKTVVIERIPIDLWRQLKAHVALKDSTIQQTVAKAIEQYLQKSA